MLNIKKYLTSFLEKSKKLIMVLQYMRYICIKENMYLLSIKIYSSYYISYIYFIL